MSFLTHVDEAGRVRMVDVSDKDTTLREAVAQGTVGMRADTLEMICRQGLAKGNVLETARIAGIQGAKKTWELIPMCHPLNLTHVQVDLFPEPAQRRIRIEGTVRVYGRTGVEMEALTAVAVAALTVYDMCKSHDKTMVVSDIVLLRKSGGRSGHFERGSEAPYRA